MTAAHVTGPTRLMLAGRGDALVPHLSRALRARYDVVGDVHVDLSRTERLLVAARTFRPVRTAWVERFFKNNRAVTLRSRRAAREIASRRTPFDVLFQTHALFEVTDPRAVLYIDCTHRQSADEWPQWNPLRGRALAVWLARERRQYHAAAHLFAFSAPTARSLVEDYGVAPERVSVVGAGVNFTELPALPVIDEDHHRVDPIEPPTVLLVGNDFERKGGPLLLEAFRRVREEIPTARLRIVGTPYPIEAQPGVEVLGRVHDREQMSALYAAATVFCLPAHFDPFPLVVLEAMAHGLPCVVTPTCGVPEMVVDGVTGRILADDDLVAELTTELVALLRDPDRAARMGAAGRRRVETRFLWTHVVERMSDVLDRLPVRTTPQPREQTVPRSIPGPTPRYGAHR